jgi:transmembrane sensor
MDRQERLNHLLNLYAENKCSKEEYDELLSMIPDLTNAELLDGLKPVYDQSDEDSKHDDADWDLLYKQVIHNKSRSKQLFPIYKKIAVAATLVMVSLIAVVFYQKQQSPDRVALANKTTAAIVLAPGGNNAVLTLSDGKKVLLNSEANGLIASQSGIRVSKSADGKLVYQIIGGSAQAGTPQFNTIETPKGGQYQISMPDGTRVWLNAMSSLKYPVRFTGGQRMVELKGEGYFEVAKNKAMPFRVKTSGQTVEVLGTHFNINAYADERNIRTTLIEGSVKVFPEQGAASAKLQPGEQSVLTGVNIMVQQVDPELAVAWKNGYFVFNKNDLQSIMREISRWYDVDVEFQNQSVRKHLFSGNISRFENAAQVLDVLELTGLVHFKVEGRRIIVM